MKGDKSHLQPKVGNFIYVFFPREKLDFPAAKLCSDFCSDWGPPKKTILAVEAM